MDESVQSGSRWICLIQAWVFCNSATCSPQIVTPSSVPILGDLGARKRQKREIWKNGRKAGRREERRGLFNHENMSDLLVFIQLSQKGLGFCDCL